MHQARSLCSIQLVMNFNDFDQGQPLNDLINHEKRHEKRKNSKIIHYYQNTDKKYIAKYIVRSINRNLYNNHLILY